MHQLNGKYIIAFAFTVLCIVLYFLWKLHNEDTVIIKSSSVQSDTITADSASKIHQYPSVELSKTPPVNTNTEILENVIAGSINLNTVSHREPELPQLQKSNYKNYLHNVTIDSISTESSFIGDDLKNVIEAGANDVISIASNPIRWESEDYMNLAIISAGTLLLFSVDKEIHKNINNGGVPSNSNLIKLGHLYGETRTTEFAALGVEAYGLIFNDRKAMKLGLEIYESYYIANSITGLLKYSIGRSRPSEGNGPYEFKTFDRGRRLCALPSGHATLAFSMSTVLASYTDDDHLKIIVYIPAFITAFSRIYENYHWASDVFLGAAIGHFVGKFITSRHNLFGDNDIQLNFDNEGRIGLRIDF